MPDKGQEDPHKPIPINRPDGTPVPVPKRKTGGWDEFEEKELGSGE